MTDVKADQIAQADDDGQHVAIVYQPPMELKDGPRQTSAAWRYFASSTAEAPKSATAATSKGSGID
jgi:hypothetical protein